MMISERVNSLLMLASAKLSQFNSMGGANFVVNHSPGHPRVGDTRLVMETRCTT